jgi:hypothetical protein
MTIKCPVCFNDNIDGVSFCEACGHDLTSQPLSSSQDPQPIAQIERVEEFSEASPVIAVNSTVLDSEADSNAVSVAPSAPLPSLSGFTPAKLIAKSPSAPIKEMLLEEDSCIVGKFDPDSGPADLDLEAFDTEGLVSRSHARLFFEAGTWQIEDSGSTNGVFIKRVGDIRFSPRITEPETLQPGDEIAFAKIRFTFDYA